MRRYLLSSLCEYVSLWESFYNFAHCLHKLLLGIYLHFQNFLLKNSWMRINSAYLRAGILLLQFSISKVTHRVQNRVMSLLLCVVQTFSDRLNTWLPILPFQFFIFAVYQHIKFGGFSSHWNFRCWCFYPSVIDIYLQSYVTSNLHYS